MPLPDGDTPWPPPAWGQIAAKYAEWSAWYGGDPNELHQVYRDRRGPQMASDAHAYDRFVERGGLVGAMRRFWGQQPRPGQQNTKLHIPAAADVASTSADLLMREAPRVTLPDGDGTPGQDRLDYLFGDHTAATLVEAAEIGAAMSGVFLRGGWDVDRDQAPFLSAVHPDAALPDFQWGQLAAVTFWRELGREGHTVLRHLERHEPGVIWHGLYRGTDDRLGRPVPVTEHPATAGLAPGLVDGQAIPTGIRQLTAVYWPNARPNRLWRSHPLGSHLGRSDLSGVEPLMDALDEAWTSWMRDLRLAKSRILAAQSYLDSMGPGKGGMFDEDREVFVPLNAMAGKDDPGITLNQFEIRHESHNATCTALFERIVTDSGYSAQTFGLTGDVAMTASEARARERKSILTTGKKARLGRLAIGQAAEMLMALDAAQFRSGIAPVRPDVEFADPVPESVTDRAQSLNMIATADATSVETRVRWLHPGWDDDQVRDEVEAIKGDRPDPAPAFDDFPA